MGNINYFGKSLKVSSIFGGHKSDRSERTIAKSEKEKKAQTMRIPKVLAQNIIFNTISNFMYHFVNFKYSLENSSNSESVKILIGSFLLEDKIKS